MSVYLMLMILMFSCVGENKVEKSIPGVFEVDFQDSSMLNSEEMVYYADLELILFPNKRFTLSKPIGSLSYCSGFWSYEGARFQKQLYLNFEDNLKVQIGVCKKPGDAFFLPIPNSIDENGMVKKLKFIKTDYVLPLD